MRNMPSLIQIPFYPAALRDLSDLFHAQASDIRIKDDAVEYDDDKSHRIDSTTDQVAT